MVAQNAFAALAQEHATATGDAHLIGNTRTKWRREFNDPTLADWLPQTGYALQWGVAGGNATLNMGTTNGAEGRLTSRQSFFAPCRIQVGLYLSQKIAGNAVYLELVAESAADPTVMDETVVAAWRISGTDSVTATIARTEVQNGGAARSITPATVAGQAAQTTPATPGLYEITLEADEVWFTSRVGDSTTGRNAPAVRNTVSPDPNRKYHARIRAVNITAPASATTVTVTHCTVVDYTEHEVEVVSGAGNSGVGQAVPVQVLNAPAVTLGGTTISANATTSGVSSTKVLSAATTNPSVVKAAAGRIYGWHLANTSAAWRYVRLTNKATAPVPGTDSPQVVIPLPPGGVVSVHHVVPINFVTGIGLSITAGSADLDSTVVAAGDVVGTLFWF